MTKARDIASASPAPSTVSATELGYLDGVTSNIQTQIDSKTGGVATDTPPASPTEGQVWLDTDGTTADANFVLKSTLSSTGDIFYASSANNPARLGIGSTDQVLKVSGGIPAWGAAPSPSFVGAWATRGSGTISITNNVAFQIPFDSEVVDTNGFHDNSTNNSRFTIPSGYGGKYLLIGYGSLSAGSSDGFTLRYYLNGSGSGDQNILQQHRNLGGNNAAIVGSRIVSLSAGDYVELYMVYNATATPTVVAAFYLYYLGA